MSKITDISSGAKMVFYRDGLLHLECRRIMYAKVDNKKWFVKVEIAPAEYRFDPISAGVSAYLSEYVDGLAHIPTY